MHGGVRLTGLPNLIIDILSGGITVVWGGFVTAKRNFMSLWNEQRWLSWRIVGSNNFGSFVGTWRVHGLNLEINADHTGKMDWNAGPCQDPMLNLSGPHCGGYAEMVFDPPRGGELTGRITSVVYKTWDTGQVVTDTSYLTKGEPIKAGLTIHLTHYAPHVLKEVWDVKPGEQGNPFLCAQQASKEWHYRCNA
jgi:hypothetical protein